MSANQDLTSKPLIPGYSVFTIPEILEKIFAYLDQRTLSRSAILVSWNWFHSARHLITHEFVWHDDKFRFYPSGIFIACEQLQDLHISSQEEVILIGPWIDQQPRQTSLPLRSLVLCNAHFQQLHLEGLLAVTPHLKRLKVLNPHRHEYDHWAVVRNPSYDTDQLVRHIKSLSLKLSYFHFTSGWDDLTPEVCPDTSERTFWRGDFNWDIENRIQSHHNVVTSLELFNHQPKDCQATTSTLHKFLCSAPHLLHLRAPQLGYQLEHMDLHGRLAFTDRLPMDFRPKATTAASTTTTTSLRKMTPTYLPGIWACRNLQTLHIRIRGPNDTESYIGSHRSLNSRIALGYLARVCPNLRDLNLTNHRHSLSHGLSVDLRLAGGLCFLGRLQHLERFRIEYWGETVIVQSKDVSWMVDEGRTAERREERRRVMARWGGLIETEESIRAVARIRMDDPPSLDWSEGCYEPGMKEALQHLGSLLDVQLAVQGMDDTDEASSHHEKSTGGPRRCFPVLRYASLANEIGIEMPLEMEVKRLLSSKAKPKV
ncbi:hypothetical protein BGZ95_000612 [Linnemannia exigua]|uniref:F-box domain-containing protein n=1 Tax=Linnemannia exigua TaxID=604196 RepID=A0AAD4H486_9FUNG|nr:hypothetical protein BGZ95_000612 [Linnemannia exigua]